MPQTEPAKHANRADTYVARLYGEADTELTQLRAVRDQASAIVKTFEAIRDDQTSQVMDFNGTAEERRQRRFEMASYILHNSGVLDRELEKLSGLIAGTEPKTSR